MKSVTTGIAFDSAAFVGATYGKYGTRYPERTYDGGAGILWAYRETLGILGIVRAETWEEAYEIVEDEIMDDADPDDVAEHEAEVMAEKRLKYPGQSDEEIYGHDAPDLPEGCTFRSNGSGSNPWNQTGIASQDLNGNSLDPLTAADLEELGIVITWEIAE